MATDTVIDERLHHEDVLERFPEIELIDDDDIRDATIDAAARGFPDYFWKAPATGSGYYHHPSARNRYGLWIHTKQVCTVYERLVRSHQEADRITDAEADAGRAACVLHDMFKFGHEYEDGDSAVPNHDLLAGQWLSSHTDVPKATCSAVESHNGAWYDGPPPSSELDQLVHMCDMVASTKNVSVGIYQPADKLVEHYPHLPQAHF